MDPMLALRGVGLASGFALHVAPLVTIREILAARSTMNYHISTYAFSLINQATNLWYAVVRDDTALIVHRTLGVIFNVYYVYIFFMYCPPAKLSEFSRTVLRLAAIFVLFFLDLHVLLPALGTETQYMSHIALFGAITGIGSTAGPLATVGEVLRTRDASSLPLPYLSMVTLQCATWTIYGYLRDDLSTFVNNLVGVVLGSIQLLLIAWFRSKRGSVSSDVAASKKFGGGHSHAHANETESAVASGSGTPGLGARVLAGPSGSAPVLPLGDSLEDGATGRGTADASVVILPEPPTHPTGLVGRAVVHANAAASVER